MKTIPPPCPEPEFGRKYWRGLEELSETPEFRTWVEREFPAGASEGMDPVSRRHFMKIMSASFLLAGLGLSGCRRPVENILPFGKQPDNYIHGVPQFYATAYPGRSGAIPLLVRSNDGRPTKIEGNPDHPINRSADGKSRHGGTDHFVQCSILNLYDPDRATRFSSKGNDIARETALDTLRQIGTNFRANGGQGLSFLLQRSSSPSRARLIAAFAQNLPNARWFAHEPVDFHIHQQAASIAFGKSVRPYYRLDQASVIVSLDCDFIGAEENTSQFCRDFARGRKVAKPGDGMNRLYVLESLMTLTGGNADHRLRIAASQVAGAAALFAEKLLGGQGGNVAEALKRVGGQLDETATTWITKCAEDVAKAKGKALFIAGHHQPLAVHLAAHALNSAIGAVGTTVVYFDAPQENFGPISDLARDLNANAVDTLVILGGNPAYDAPVDLNWKATQAKAKNVVRWAYYEDETSTDGAVNFHLPAAHYLESWGDARTFDGTLVAIQPLIEPLFGGVTELEVLARIAGSPQTRSYDIVRETFRALAGGNDFEEGWKHFLHNGFAPNTASQPAQGQFNAAAVAGAITGQATPAPSKDNFEVVFHRDHRVDDGRFNNNGWLQEMPDPITKITWDNVILVSPQTAKDLGITYSTNEMGNFHVQRVRVEVGGRTVEGPAWIQPGQADNVVGLLLGYGRAHSGRVGRNIGYNAYAVRTSNNLHFAPGAKLTRTGGKDVIACTQTHWLIHGRPVVREANLEQFEKHPKFAKGMDMEPVPIVAPLYPNPLDAVASKTHQWGMSIDLSSCVGCSSCVAACQSENNVPIVGKEMVGRSREMHWLRIDRYFSGSEQNPQMVMQPMLCQHCEAAPCESVCPVNATVHDHEGLNLMVYNRCVGTRYCSNNCPWKVRRFNYFDYNKRPLDQIKKSPLITFTDGEWEMKRWAKDPNASNRPADEWDLVKMVKNPDVTVRMRGVMEKCTFCVQRIEGAKIAQKVKAGASGDVQVPDGTFTTACAQACPTEAIVFGNLQDPNSRVSQLKTQDRDYTMLEYLHTKPRLTYMARIRNPNKEMPDFQEHPASMKEFIDKRSSPFEAHHGAAASHGTNGAGAHAAPQKGGAH